MNRAPILLAVALGLAWLATAASADDGVVEINQTSVGIGGITPGDAPGFPATLDRSGSYRLTSNLRVPVNTHGVLIDANDVTLDLNGFTISGPTIVNCPIGGCPPNAGSGVMGEFPAEGATVRNGMVTDMGGTGVALNATSHVEGVRARSNGGSGITTGPSSLLRGNIASKNQGAGISAGAGSTVVGNTMEGNEIQGLRCPKTNGLTCGYGLNVLMGNGDGTSAGQVLFGIQTSGNVCGLTSCP